MGDWLATVSVMSFCAIIGLFTLTMNALMKRAERKEREAATRTATAEPESR